LGCKPSAHSIGHACRPLRSKQIDFIRASAIPLAMIGLLTAAPHTQLWRRLEREDRLLGGFTGNNTDGVLNFTPRMEPGRLVEKYRGVLRALDIPRAYYRRALDSLTRIGEGVPEPEPGGGLFNRLTTLARVLYNLGVHDPERRSSGASSAGCCSIIATESPRRSSWPPWATTSEN
jgi:hypothetical protein